ncbi:Ser-Thr-rich GPI-anchored membrane family protein, partial [Bacteroidota bacterium]
MKTATIFYLFIVIAIILPISISAQAPDPNINNITGIPSEVQPGEVFYVSVSAINNGNYSDNAWIWFEFPGLTNSLADDFIHWETLDGDFYGNYSEYNPGTVLANESGGSTTLSYLLVGARDYNWYNNESNLLEIEVTIPSNYTDESFPVYIRSSMVCPTGTECVGDVINYPNSGFVDQLGWNILVYNIPITYPEINITSPSVEENWYTGNTQVITWSSQDLSGNVKIELFSGNDIAQLISNSTSNDGSYSFFIPISMQTGTNYKIKISSVEDPAVFDESSMFNITRCITVTYPNGGETWYLGFMHNISWNSPGFSDNVRVELHNNTGLYHTIFSNTTDDGSQNWTVLEQVTPGSNYRIKIINVNNSNQYDFSDISFNIIEYFDPTISVNSPNGGEIWNTGQSYNITWTSQDITGNVKIELYKSGSYNSTIHSNTSNDGSYSWSVPAGQTNGSDYKITITSIDDPGINDQSDSYFTILTPNPTITLTSPNGGETWNTEQSYNIIWTSQFVTGNVKIELYKSGSYNSTIISNTSNDGSYSWSVPTGQTNGSDYKITITSIDDPGISDQSNGYFTILTPNPTITLTSPNGGESLNTGQSYNITWTSQDITGNVKIELYKSGSYNSII